MIVVSLCRKSHFARDQSFRFCCFIFPRYKNGYVWSGLLTEQYMYVYVFRYFFINGVEHIVLMEGDNVVPSLCRE